MAKKRSRMADVLLGGPDSYREPYHIRRIREREEKEARAGMPTSGTKGVKLDRERDKPSKKLDTKSLSAEERKKAGRTKQSRRGSTRTSKEPPAFTVVERPPGMKAGGVTVARGSGAARPQNFRKNG